MTPESNLIEVDGHVIHRECNGRPVLFLDIDHTIAPENGGPIDREAARRVNNIVHYTEAVVVICSDRVREPGCYDMLVDAGIQAHTLRGQCDPMLSHMENLATAIDPRGVSTSAKVLRIVRWLEIAEANFISPSAWCVLDDASTLAFDWRTCNAHVKPSGSVVTEKDMDHVWSILLHRLMRNEPKPIKVANVMTPGFGCPPKAQEAWHGAWYMHGDNPVKIGYSGGEVVGRDLGVGSYQYLSEGKYTPELWRGQCDDEATARYEAEDQRARDRS